MILGFIFSLLFASNLSQAAEPQSFKEWKRSQVSRAYNHSVKAKNQWLLSQRRKDKRELSARYKSDLLFSRQAVEIAKDFTIHDYIEQYLSGLKNPEVQVRKLSAKMTRPEINKLLVAMMRSTRLRSSAAGTNNTSSLQATSALAN